MIKIPDTDRYPDRFLAIHEGTEFLGRKLSPAEVQGFRDFFAGRLVGHANPSSTVGWYLARQLCFAQGAIAADLPGDHDSPYPQFSPAWEAWADGFNTRAHKALDFG